MSRKFQRNSAALRKRQAPIFAALGDETRLAIVGKLSAGEPHSISELTDGTELTRQAVTKHLHVLEAVGMVRSIKAGRENLYQFNPKPIEEIKTYLQLVSEEWDRTIDRLRAFVEDD